MLSGSATLNFLGWKQYEIPQIEYNIVSTLYTQISITYPMVKKPLKKGNFDSYRLIKLKEKNSDLILDSFSQVLSKRFSLEFRR